MCHTCARLGTTDQAGTASRHIKKAKLRSTWDVRPEPLASYGRLNCVSALVLISRIRRTDDAHALLDCRGICRFVPRVGIAIGDRAATAATAAAATTTATRSSQGVQASSGQAAPAGGRPDCCNVSPAAYRHRREEGPRRTYAYPVAEVLLDPGRQGRCREEQIGVR